MSCWYCDATTCPFNLNGHTYDTSKPEAEAARTFMLGFKAVIGRFVPEQKAVEHTGEVIHRNAEDLTDAELADIAQRGRERVAPPPGSTH